MPFISICIPTYKRAAYLGRLLQSIAEQTFKDFEVVITDDSPDHSVKEICAAYAHIPQLIYHKNDNALGTPANWNAAMQRAKGQWIKLMHDDDWFASTDALQQFADCAMQHENDFIFCAYTNVYNDAKNNRPVFPEIYRIKAVQKEPSVLLAKNLIGPPSTTLHKNDGCFLYDTNLKWLVDIDVYRRRLETDTLQYIPYPLINVGIGNTQVTSYTKNVGRVEVPEHFHFLEKMGIEKLENIIVYDYNWRFLRNFHVTQPEQLRKYGYSGSIHPVLQAMIKTQSKLPAWLLKQGVFSKIWMAVHYLKHKNRLR